MKNRKAPAMMIDRDREASIDRAVGLLRCLGISVFLLAGLIVSTAVRALENRTPTNPLIAGRRSQDVKKVNAVFAAWTRSRGRSGAARGSYLRRFRTWGRTVTLRVSNKIVGIDMYLADCGCGFASRPL